MGPHSGRYHDGRLSCVCAVTEAATQSPRRRRAQAGSVGAVWSQLPCQDCMLWSKVTPDLTHWPDPGTEAPASQGARMWKGQKWAGNPESPRPAPRSPSAPVTLPCASDVPSPGSGPVPAQARHRRMPGVSVVSKNEGPCACPVPGVGGTLPPPRQSTPIPPPRKQELGHCDILGKGDTGGASQHPPRSHLEPCQVGTARDSPQVGAPVRGTGPSAPPEGTSSSRLLAPLM